MKGLQERLTFFQDSLSGMLYNLGESGIAQHWSILGLCFTQSHGQIFLFSSWSQEDYSISSHHILSWHQLREEDMVYLCVCLLIQGKPSMEAMSSILPAELPFGFIGYRTGLYTHTSGKKKSACQYRRLGFDPWVGKIPWSRKWQPVQYSCLGNSIESGAWGATVQGAAKSQTRLSN